MKFRISSVQGIQVPAVEICTVCTVPFVENNPPILTKPDVAMLLPSSFPSNAGGSIITIEPTTNRGLSLGELISAILGITYDSDIDSIRKYLIDRGKTWNPKQVAWIIGEHISSSNPVRFLRKCVRNFFPVDTMSGHVATLTVQWSCGEWKVNVEAISSDFKLGRGNQLLIRN